MPLVRDGVQPTLTTAGDQLVRGSSGIQRLGIASQPVFNVKSPPYGAAGDDSTDDTTAIQAAIDAANAAAGGVVYFPAGRYKITDSLIWKPGVAFDGAQGSGSIAARLNYPQLRWYGSATADGMIVTDDSQPPNWVMSSLQRLTLHHVVGQNRPKNGIYFSQRCDSGTYIADVQLRGMAEYGIVFAGGGINVHLRDFRTDEIRYSTIKWVQGVASDSLSLRDFTTDNDPSDVAEAGGTLDYDGTAAPNNAKFYFRAMTGKVETNYNMTANNAHFLFRVKPTVSQRHTVYAQFDDVWEAPGGGVTTYKGIRVLPASDYVSIALNNSKLSIDGIPHYANSVIGTTTQQTLLSIAPHGTHIGTSPTSELQAAGEFVGVVNVIGPLYQHGRIAEITIAETEANLTGVTLHAGMKISDPAGVGGGHHVVREVASPGTCGTLAGVTASGTSGANTITVNTVAGLKLGHYITIGGLDNKRIQLINPDTLTVTLTSNLANTHSSASVAFTAPTFREGQLIPLSGSKTWDPGSVAVGGSATTTVTVTGATLGDFVVPSFSLDLQGLVLSAYVSATNTVTCVLSNPTAGAVDLASGTLKVKVSSR